MGRLAIGFAALAVATAPALASAHPDDVAAGFESGDVSDSGSDVDRWRAHLSLDLGSWLRQVPWPRVDPGVVGTRDDIGFVGFQRFGFGFGLGRGFGDMFVVGMHFEYGISRGIQRTPSASTSFVHSCSHAPGSAERSSPSTARARSTGPMRPRRC